MKTQYYTAASLDGFIATTDDSLATKLSEYAAALSAQVDEKNRALKSNL